MLGLGEPLRFFGDEPLAARNLLRGETRDLDEYLVDLSRRPRAGQDFLRAREALPQLGQGRIERAALRVRSVDVALGFKRQLRILPGGFSLKVALARGRRFRLGFRVGQIGPGLPQTAADFREFRFDKLRIDAFQEAQVALGQQC